MYNLLELPKEWREPLYGNDPNFFLAFERDNEGMFDKKSNKFYKTGRYIKGLGNRWLKQNKIYVVTDEKNNKFKIKKLEIMQEWPELGIAEIKYLGKNKLER